MHAGKVQSGPGWSGVCVATEAGEAGSCKMAAVQGAAPLRLSSLVQFLLAQQVVDGMRAFVCKNQKDRCNSARLGCRYRALQMPCGLLTC